MRSPRVSAAAAILLLATVTSGLAQEAAPSMPPPVAGRTAAEWVDRLAKASGPGAIELAAAGADALPMVRYLLDDADRDVANGAAFACERLGAAAAPLYDLLVARLRAAPSWWQQVHCAGALAAIGRRDPAVRTTLLDHLATSTVPHLRSACARAFARLEPDAGRQILAAVANGQFAARERAVDALVWNGDAVAPDLLAALDDGRDGDGIAAEALVQIGWRMVPRLEQAGHRELAKRALLLGPLRHVVGAESCEPVWREPPPTVERLPLLIWESGFGHGGGFECCWGSEDGRGFRVVRVALREDGNEPTRALLETMTLPRDLAFALMRQLMALPCIELRDRTGKSVGTTGDFHAAVRATLDDTTTLDLAFTGYPIGGNLQQRFRAQAAQRILAEAVAGATWRPYELTDSERTRFENRCGRAGPGEPRWVTQALQRLHDLVEPR